MKEQFNLSSGDFQKALATEKQNSDRKTTMERIWNSEKIRFAGKYLVSENLLQIGPSQFDYSNSLEEKLERTEISSISLYAEYITPTLTSSSGSEIAPTEIIYVGAKGDVVISFTQSSDSVKALVNGIYDLSDVSNLTILLMLVPFASFVFIKFEKEKFKFSNFKKILGLSLALILISPIGIIPAYASSNYWNIAFAETPQEQVQGLDPVVGTPLMDDLAGIAIPLAQPTTEEPTTETTTEEPTTETTTEEPTTETTTEEPTTETTTETTTEEPVTEEPVNATRLDVTTNFLGYLIALFEIPNADAAEPTEEDKLKSEIKKAKQEKSSWQVWFLVFLFLFWSCL